MNKKFVLETCKGSVRLQRRGKTLLCDNTKADIGDGCGHDGARACSVDGKKELRCRDGKFAVEWSCRGGCTLDANNNPKCTPTGEVGDICRPDSIVCDGAQKTQLDCVDGKLAVNRTCHGARGCETAPGGGVRCDRTIALEDEACTQEGIGACDPTQKNVLVCQGGKFKTQLHCLGDLRLRAARATTAFAATRASSPSDEACTEDGAVSCTPDGKQVKCTDGKLGARQEVEAEEGRDLREPVPGQLRDGEVRGAVGGRARSSSVTPTKTERRAAKPPRPPRKQESGRP